jgi:hypothetical protein
MKTKHLLPAGISTILVLVGLSMPTGIVGWASAHADDRGTSNEAAWAEAHPTSLHVSTSGKDDWSGRFAAPNGTAGDGPFATLTRARDAIRQLKKSPGLLEGGVTVWIAAGTYLLEQGFELTAEDSGDTGRPIVYRAAGDGPVRIAGGRIVTGWQRVADPVVLARLEPSARGNVVQANLKAQGITNYGTLRSRGFGRSTVPAALELFFQNRPMTLARWPNAGFVTIAKYVEPVGDDHGGTMGKLAAGFHYEGDRPERWAQAEDLWIHGYWAYDWANSYEHVASLDKSRRLIKTDPPHGNYGFRTGQRFYFLNILDELDEPGEWYLDCKSGILYFWPPAPLEEGDVAVSLAETPLIRMDNASHVQVRGLTLECGRADAVQIAGGNDNLVADCTIRNLGNSGVTVNGGTSHGIVNCVIHEAGDGGISLTGGDRKTLTPANHYARNNHIHHVARWSRCYAPALSMTGVGIQASNNLIHDHPHCAILFWGNEHTIELNEIHHVCLETGDVGAIYTGRDYTFRGNVVRHNFIHHTGGVGMGSMGIYMDDCVSGTHIYGNVLWKLHRAVFLGGGRDFKVENNIFIDCDPAVELDGRGLSTSPVWHNMVYQTMKKRLQDVNWREPPYRTRYPELADLEPYYAKDDGVPPGKIVVARNICVGSQLLRLTWGGVKEGMAETKDNLVNADPLFTDAAHGDFRLKPDSPAYRLGFQPIPFDKIGRQASSADGPAPGFQIRGTLPWHNFLSGPTAWNRDDYERYLDRMRELRLNFVGFHCYTGGAERYAPYVEPMIRIEYRDVVPTASFDTSLTARWGYRPLAVRDFAFGTAGKFPLPAGARAFGADCAILARGNEDRYRRAQDLMRQVLDMAHARGIQMAMGFEFGIHPPELASIVPPDSWIRGAMLPDPTHPASIEILHATIDDILRAYPGLDWIWLWLHEHTMFIQAATLSGDFRKLYDQEAQLFEGSGQEDAKFTGVWSLAYIRAAYAHIRQRAPQVKIALGGWGGGGQLPAILTGLDRALPRDIVFTCLNPNQGWAPQPDFMAQIAKNRAVWAIPWLEGDRQLWHLQPRVKLLRDHVKLADTQDLAGVVAIHWRTRETRLNLDTFARFAAAPKLETTVETVYQEDCSRQFGEEAGRQLASILAQMDTERWLDPPNSEEYFPYHPRWGRVDTKLRQRLSDVIELVEKLKAQTKGTEYQANLAWLHANLQFTLLLDDVGRKIEPAYELKNRWLTGKIDKAGLAQDAKRAKADLDSAPIEELLKTYAAHATSRGELGVLSSLNQKLWLQHRELKEFLASVEARAK